jgi:MFS family permease
VLLGPLAGTLVDRWNRRTTMAVCDLLRAVLLLAVPLVIGIDVALVYVMAFLIATVTLLFRPAKTAVIPAVVEERDLVTANSMSSVADTAADLVGLPLAGVLIGGALMGSLEVAFVLGASTYLVSAVLIWAMQVPKQELISSPMRLASIWQEMVEGWNFLRRQVELFSNTIISTVAQLAVGAEIVATIPYSQEVLATTDAMPPETVYALLLSSIALGSVVGGVGVGWIGDRVPKGPMTIIGFIGMGLSLVAAGFVREPLVAIGIFFFTGLFNMVFIIPTITLFQQRTPQRLMGRVVSSRQALVFGAIAASMGLSGWLADLIGADLVLVAAGTICAVAGATGLLIPAMRRAR